MSFMQFFRCPCPLGHIAALPPGPTHPPGLAVPEIVPFRLTRDIVAGLGCLGVDGLFRKRCETCLETLRQAADIVVAVVEVFVHDPLYRWSLSPSPAGPAAGLHPTVLSDILRRAQTVFRLLSGVCQETQTIPCVVPLHIEDCSPFPHSDRVACRSEERVLSSIL